MTLKPLKITLKGFLTTMGGMGKSLFDQSGPQLSPSEVIKDFSIEPMGKSLMTFWRWKGRVILIEYTPSHAPPGRWRASNDF